MGTHKGRIIHAFVSKKVVEIDNKRYSNLEKIPAIESDSENLIVVIREVELKERVYKHPVRGDIYNYSYEKINASPKRYVTLEKWSELEDVNTSSFNVHMSSAS